MLWKNCKVQVFMLICPYTKEKIVSVPRRGEIVRDETKMDVYTSGVTGAEYAAGMKQLMSNKENWETYD